MQYKNVCCTIYYISHIDDWGQGGRECHCFSEKKTDMMCAFDNLVIVVILRVYESSKCRKCISTPLQISL